LAHLFSYLNLTWYCFGCGCK